LRMGWFFGGLRMIYRFMEDASCACPPAWAVLRPASASQSNTDLPWGRK